jgi:hypothetical protein
MHFDEERLRTVGALGSLLLTFTRQDVGHWGNPSILLDDARLRHLLRHLQPDAFARKFVAFNDLPKKRSH